MNKVRLFGFAVPKKNSGITKKTKRKNIYQQIGNPGLDGHRLDGRRLDGKNSYSKPDRFALARFNRQSLQAESHQGQGLNGAKANGAKANGAKANGEGVPYRSRAAFKLLEIEDKYRVCSEKKRILELGAAPGGWSQVVLEVAPNAKLLAIDQKTIAPLHENYAAQRLQIMQENLQEQKKFPEIAENIVKLLGGKPDCIISDLAPDTIGMARIDNDRFASLLENIMPLVLQSLLKGGDFLTKLRHSAAEKSLLDSLKTRFSKLHLIKPQASRKSANEIYLLAKKFHS